MPVGGVGRKGRGGAGGAGGSSGSSQSGSASGAGKAQGTFRVEPNANAAPVDSMVPASGAQGSANVGAAGPVGPLDPIAAQALSIAQMVKAGQLAREEATKRLVTEILGRKLRMKSSALSAKIAEVAQDDPRLHQLLERLWSKG